MAKAGDPEDTELDPPLTNEDEPEDLQDNALVESEADEESEQDSPDAAASADGQAPDQPDRQPSRRDRRIEALTTSLAEERRQREELNRRLDGWLAGQVRPQQESPEARAQRLALLTPEERITTELNDAKMGFARDLARVQFTSQDQADRAAFQARAANDSRYRKWESQVEAELATLRSQGQTIERQKLMYYLVGKDLFENAPGSPEVRQQRRAAERRVQRQTARPANSGSDVASRRERGTSLERRLENIEL